MAACGSASADDSSASSAGASGDAGADGADVAITLKFVPGEPITLEPKQRLELTVEARQSPPTGIVDPNLETPPVSQLSIRFGLTGADATSTADAVLDATDVLTDENGLAHVTLIAPSKPTMFNVRASTSARTSTLQGVTVRATRITTLSVQPAYSGPRAVTEWTASALPGVSCSDLEGNPPRDGDLLASGPPDSPVLLYKVPVGMNMAVTVRAGHYVSGCVNQAALSEGDGNQVLVYASDLPLNLASTTLSLNFGATDAHPALDKLLLASATTAAGYLLGDAKNDIAALLDGMLAASPASDRDAFEAVRSEHDWDVALESAYGSKSAARCLRDPVQRWLTAGIAALNAPDAFSGKLEPLGGGTAATFSPYFVGGASPDAAGLPGYFPVLWSADSNDTVQLGFELNWQPSRLVTALAVAPAVSEFPAAKSIEQALSQSVGCEQVANALLAAGEAPGVTAYASCDQSCLVQACQASVAAAWSRVRLSSGNDDVDKLSVTASGTAQVGDDARAIALSGSWVGVLTTKAGDTASASGSLSGD